MSDTTGQPGADVLALGLDSAAVERGVAQAAASLNKLERSAEQASQAWDGLLDAIGDTGPRAQQVAQPTEVVSQSVERLGRRTTDAARQISEASRAMTDQRDRVIALSQTLTGYITALDRVTAAQRLVNETAQVLRGENAGDIVRVARAMQELREQYNPLYAAGQQYRRELEAIREAHRIGAISAKEMAEAQDRLKASTQAQVASLRGMRSAGEEAAGGVRLAAHQMTNLSYQIQDAAVQLSMGQNPLMILMQQGPQASAAVGGVSNGIALLRQAFSPTQAAVALMAAGMVGWVLAMERASSQMADLRTKLRATRDDYVAMAQAVREASREVGGTSGIATSDARAAGTAIVGARGFSGTQAEIQNLIRLSADLARVMGQDMPTAAATLSKALADPGKVSRELADTGMFGFNDVLRRNVEQLVAQGDKAAATRLVLDQYSRRIQGAADDVGALTRMWRSLTKAIDDAFDAIGRYIDRQNELRRRSPDLTDEFGFTYPGRGANGQPLARPGQAVAGENITPGLAVLSRRDASSREIEAAVREQAIRMGLDAGFAAAIARTESGFRQYGPDGSVLRSPAGARGIMQLMPGTARELGVDPDDPIQNVIGGLRYLQAMLRGTGGDQSLAAAAYNAGPGRVQDYLRNGRALPDETLRYIASIGAQGALTGAAGAVSRGDGITRGFDGPADRLRFLRGQEGALSDILNTQGLDQAGEAAQRYREKLEEIRREIVALESPTEKMTRQQQLAAEIWRTGAGAARALAQAEQQAAEAIRSAGGDAQEQAIAAMNARKAKQDELLAQLADAIEKTDRATEAQQAEAAALLDGAAAMAQVADQRRAELEALQYAAPATIEYQRAVEALTGSYQRQRAAAADIQTARQAIQSGQQLEYLRAEVQLIGQSAEARERELAALRVRQDIIARGGDPSSGVSQAAIANAQSIASTRQELDRTQTAFNELASVGEQAFSRIGQAITQGLVSGTAKTIEFGTIVKGVLSEVIQYFLKIAALNPILNGLFGRNLTTIGDVGGIVGRLVGGTGSIGGGGSVGGLAGVIGAVGGGGSTGDSASGGGFSLSSLLNVGSLASRGWSWISGGVGRLANSLNPGSWSLLQGTGLGDFFNTPILGGGGVSQAAWTPLASGVQGPVATAGDFGVTTIGSYLGAAGLGFGAGSLVGGLVANARGTQGPGSTIGAGVGSLIGAIGGPVGAILGGVLGGAAGGFIGPTKKGMAERSGVAAIYTFDDQGYLKIQDIGGKRYDVAGFQADLEGQFGDINNALRERGLRFGGAFAGSVGAGQAAGRAGVPTEVNPDDLARYLTSANPTYETALTALRNRGAGFDESLQEIDWVRNTYEPAIAAARKSQDAFSQAIYDLGQQFEPAINHARNLGLATDDLSRAYQEQYDLLIEQRSLQVGGINANLTARERTLAGDQQGATLALLDQQSKQELYDVRERLKGLGLSADDLAGTLDRLRGIQEEERAAAIRRYEEAKAAEEKARQDSAAANAGAVVLSLADYTRGLRTSGASPLSAQSQFALASSQFDQTLAAAAAGDWTATQNLQGYASNLLGAGRNLYGSGTAYVETFNRVLAALEQVAGQPAEQLTASVLRSETRTQTDVLKQALSDLTAEVAGLRREVQQAGSTPARIAA